MTTGNVSASKDMTISILGSGLQNATVSNSGNGLDFQSFIQTHREGFDSVSATSASVRPDLKNTDSGTDVGYESKAKEILKSAQETTENISERDVATVTEQVKSAVKDILGLSDEELEQNLAQLGLTVTDLLVPQNLIEFVASVNGVEASQIITDSQLTTQVKDLMQSISDLLNQVAVKLDIPVEQLVQLIKEQAPIQESETVVGDQNLEQKTSDDIVAAEEPVVTIVKVKDEETGKTIEVTMKGKIAEESKVTQTANVQETTQSSDTNSNSSGKEESTKEDAQNSAQSILQNLKTAYQNVTGVGATSNTVVPVDQSAIIQQIIDTVKVNVTGDLSSMEIQLTPENLGKINLSVASKDGILTATILTQNETVKTAVENQLYQLKENLNNQGIKVQSVEVAVANQGFDSNAENGHDQNSNSQSGHGRRFRGVDELPDDEISMTDTLAQAVMENNGNSLNLKA